MITIQDAQNRLLSEFKQSKGVNKAIEMFGKKKTLSKEVS